MNFYIVITKSPKMLKVIKNLLENGDINKELATKAVNLYLKDKNFNESNISELIVESMLEEEKPKEESKKEIKKENKKEIKKKITLNIISKPEQAKPEQVVKQAKPEQVVKQAKPEQVVEQAKPEQVVKQAKPEQAISQAKPEQVVKQAKPEQDFPDLSNVALPPVCESADKPKSWWQDDDEVELGDKPKVELDDKPKTAWSTITKKKQVYEKVISPLLTPKKEQVVFENDQDFYNYINESISEIEQLRAEQGEDPIYEFEGQSSRNVIFGIPLPFGVVDKYNVKKFYSIDIKGKKIKFPVVCYDTEGNFRKGGWPIDSDNYVKFQLKSRFFHKLNFKTFEWDHYDSYANEDGEISFEHITKDELISRLKSFNPSNIA